jgi:hypothetical protein
MRLKPWKDDDGDPEESFALFQISFQHTVDQARIMRIKMYPKRQANRSRIRNMTD